ncbi:tail completion protein gp17 [Sphingomonas immobilis]|uniref:DUF3168 domain-containing protein n=1 Tax=Sphingomonas immobilis TaxID=3063997 RepID=A0ABT9A1X8_9SPHN|nr:DUF3168 domain-containing protein [Sphingomonas sp. CA1-15]MDO7843452.1 hypothetical protein [Sphingomonas sp. CA1-15]
MSKAKSIVEAVTFDALEAVITGATVYQDAPENAPGNLVILGDMKSVRLATKGTDADRRVSISIVSIVEAEERAPLLALQEQIDDALDGLSFERDGWTLAFEFEDDDAVLAEDGSTYNGISSYSVLALAP